MDTCAILLYTQRARRPSRPKTLLKLTDYQQLLTSQTEFSYIFVTYKHKKNNYNWGKYNVFISVKNCVKILIWSILLFSLWITQYLYMIFRQTAKPRECEKKSNENERKFIKRNNKIMYWKFWIIIIFLKIKILSRSPAAPQWSHQSHQHSTRSSWKPEVDGEF